MISNFERGKSIKRWYQFETTKTLFIQPVNESKLITLFQFKKESSKQKKLKNERPDQNQHHQRNLENKND